MDADAGQGNTSSSSSSPSISPSPAPSPALPSVLRLAVTTRTHAHTLRGSTIDPCPRPGPSVGVPDDDDAVFSLSAWLEVSRPVEGDEDATPETEAEAGGEVGAGARVGLGIPEFTFMMSDVSMATSSPAPSEPRPEAGDAGLEEPMAVLEEAEEAEEEVDVEISPFSSATPLCRTVVVPLEEETADTDDEDAAIIFTCDIQEAVIDLTSVPHKPVLVPREDSETDDEL